MKIPMIQIAAMPHPVISQKPATTHITNETHNVVYKLPDDDFKTKSNLNNLIHNQTLKQTPDFHSSKSGNSDDPFVLIFDVLRNYMVQNKLHAKELVNDIQKKAAAIIFVKQTWSKILDVGLSQTDVNNPNNVYDGYKNNADLRALYEKTESVFATPGHWIEKGIHWHGDKKGPSYQQLYQLDAIVSSYCLEKSSDLKNNEQQFKDKMTEFNSTQSEVIDLLRYVQGFCKM